jgi:hypothetical protein
MQFKVLAVTAAQGGSCLLDDLQAGPRGRAMRINNQHMQLGLRDVTGDQDTKLAWVRQGGLHAEAGNRAGPV